ncbi:MAG: hypothetical protein ATN35_02905 [Epulopiscium sp. Nele67-Bin004]|nr:MAG: hypothetical protein ATN35_02905 [Epulopiscium sp. Nele67-Bin004]
MLLRGNCCCFQTAVKNKYNNSEKMANQTVFILEKNVCKTVRERGGTKRRKERRKRKNNSQKKNNHNFVKKPTTEWAARWISG